MSLLKEIESALKNAPPITVGELYQRIEKSPYLRHDTPAVGRKKVAKNLASLKCWGRAFHAGRDEVSGVLLWSAKAPAEQTGTDEGIAPANNDEDLVAAIRENPAQDIFVTTSSMSELSGLPPNDRIRKALDAMHGMILEEIAMHAVTSPRVNDKRLILQALQTATRMLDVIDPVQADFVLKAHYLINQLEEAQ